MGQALSPVNLANFPQPRRLPPRHFHRPAAWANFRCSPPRSPARPDDNSGWHSRSGWTRTSISATNEVIRWAPLSTPAYRVLYAFDPRRVAILLLGGDKTGDDRWYEKNVPLADRLYDNYLAGIEEEDDAKDDQVQ